MSDPSLSTLISKRKLLGSEQHLNYFYLQELPWYLIILYKYYYKNIFSVKPASTGSVPGAAGAAAVGSTVPSWAVQCPIKHPFSKYRAGSTTVDECCKCQSQTKCQAAGNANYPNVGGAAAMDNSVADDVVDKSKFFMIYRLNSQQS